MKKSSANLSTVERSMASGGRLSQCRRLGKYLNFRVKKKKTESKRRLQSVAHFLMRYSAEGPERRKFDAVKPLNILYKMNFCRT